MFEWWIIKDACVLCLCACWCFIQSAKRKVLAVSNHSRLSLLRSSPVSSALLSADLFDPSRVSLFCLPSLIPVIIGFSNRPIHMRPMWLKYDSFSFTITSYSWMTCLIASRMQLFVHQAGQGICNILFQYRSSKLSISSISSALSSKTGTLHITSWSVHCCFLFFY